MSLENEFNKDNTGPVADTNRETNSDEFEATSESIVVSESYLDNNTLSQSNGDDTPMSESGDNNFGSFSSEFDDEVIDPSVEAHNQQVEAHSVSSSTESVIIKEIGVRPVPLPIIGKLPAKTQYGITFGMLIASLMLAGGMVSTGFLKSAEYKHRAEIGTSLQMLSQRLLSTTQYAISGSKEAGENLQKARKELDVKLTRLVDGDAALSGMDVKSNAELALVHAKFRTDIIPRIDQVIELAPSLVDLKHQNQMLADASSSVSNSADQLLSYFQLTSAPEIHVAAAIHIRVLSERIRRNGQTLLTSNDVSTEPLAEFITDVRSVTEAVADLAGGDRDKHDMPRVYGQQALKILDSLDYTTGQLTDVVDYFERIAPALIKSRQNLESLIKESEAALTHSEKFADEMNSISEDSLGTVYLAAIFVAAALASLALIGVVNNRATRMDAWDASFKSKRNEKDIISFMEACLPLEMGDLTVRFNQNMEAMEGLTGGIRNSVNEAVISLHDALGMVKRTAVDVSEVVTRSVVSTTEMKMSNERQAFEISDVQERVSNLTRAITDVTSMTLDAAKATGAAKTASDEGAKVVSQTNAKMSMIRANMQDVLKSVKHLGETSHEIVDIVNTIEQITDRTQVLAVNASLEAAKAGAAGAGFQIIAGEVNRLAEQSAEALKTITALVQRVQGETGVAIRVVEESTSNVIDGARLSEIANKQLEDISGLASNLSHIMEDIRTQSEGQSLNAQGVLVSMEKLGELSREFQSQVSSVVGGVEQIDTSMGSLKNTVSIFTTEDDQTAEDQNVQDQRSEEM